MMKSNCILILNLFVFVILTFRNETRSLKNGNHFSNNAMYYISFSCSSPPIIYVQILYLIGERAKRARHSQVQILFL